MRSILSNINKIILFGILGAIGGLAAAAAGEALIGFPTNSGSKKPQVDVMFVLDVSSSMQRAIDGVKNGIGTFVNGLSPSSTDFRIGLITFADYTDTRNPAEQPTPLTFSSGTFTADVSEFKNEMGKVSLLGGGDGPEQSLAALVLAAKQAFRPCAAKVAVLITDAPPRNQDADNPNFDLTSSKLMDNKVTQLHFVIPDSLRGDYGRLHSDKVKGGFYSANNQNFDIILPQLSGDVGKTMIANMPVGCDPSQTNPQQFEKTLLASGLWTSLLAVGILLALLVGVNTHARNQVKLKNFLLGSLVSIFAGAAAGITGEVIFGTVSGGVLSDFTGRIATWSLFGTLLGLVIALFVPNLKLLRGGIGGAIGGAIGAFGFIWAGEIFNDMTGRLAGAAIIGFFIGIMIVFAELLLREAWLELSYGPRDKKTVTIGAEPVLVGSDTRHCNLIEGQARPLEMRFTSQSKGIFVEVFNDRLNNFEQPRPIQKGMAWRVGNATLTVLGR